MWQQLAQLETVYEYSGDVLILTCLYQHEPLLFSELARLMQDESGMYRADAVLTKNMPRLRETGFVSKDESDPNHPVYRLTDRGRRAANVLSYVADQLRHRYGDALSL